MKASDKPFTIEDLAKGEKIIKEAAREAGVSSSEFAEVLVFVFSKGGGSLERHGGLK